MKSLAILLCILFPLPLLADDVEFYRQKLAIARAKLATPAAASDGSTPATAIIGPNEIAPSAVVRYTTRQVRKQTGTRRVKQCVNGVCSYRLEPVYGWVTERVPITTQAADDYATPLDAAKRILEFMRPSSPQTLLDLGSGDGRMVVEWSRWTGYPAIGIEQDPQRVALSRAFAKRKGVSHLATFIEGDYTAVDLPAADVVYVYQFPEDLAAVRDKLTQYPLVVSFSHQVPGLSMTSHNGGEFFSWRKPVFKAVAAKPVGVLYGGRYYTRPVCNRPNCAMCNYLRRALAAQGATR